MDTKTIAQHFGGPGAAQRALGISRQLWHFWSKHGVPEGKQYKIQIITGGALQAVTKRADKCG